MDHANFYLSTVLLFLPQRAPGTWNAIWLKTSFPRKSSRSSYKDILHSRDLPHLCHFDPLLKPARTFSARFHRVAYAKTPVFVLPGQLGQFLNDLKDGKAKMPSYAEAARHLQNLHAKSEL